MVGAEVANIRLACSHTHSRPPYGAGSTGGYHEAPGVEMVPAYRDKVLRAVRASAREARIAEVGCDPA